MQLQLHALAYNLATFLRCIELSDAMADWSLTSLQMKLIHCLAGDACIIEKEGRGAFSTPCLCRHLPAGRGGRHRPDGMRHPRCHPPISSATIIRMTGCTSKLNESDRTGLPAALKSTASEIEHGGFAV